MNVKKASITIFFSALFLTPLVKPIPGWAGNASPEAAMSRRAIEPSLAKTVTAAMFEHKEKKIFLIDVRRAARFEKYHIPGALNIPLHAVKAKAFLKTKPLVLLNDGYEVAPLAKTCRALRKIGYKASVLAGGLCAWEASGGALTGGPFARRRMNLITAAQFQRERAVEHLKVVHLSDTSDPKGKAPGAEVMPLSNRKKTISRIKSWIKAKNANPFTRVVLMTAAGRENHRIQRWLLDAGLDRQVFILEGGLQAYQKQLAFNSLAQKPKRERKKSTGGCQSCTHE